MAASTSLTPAERKLRARLAGYTGWANTVDRTARTAPGHRSSPGSADYWLDKVDPTGLMTPEARRAAAEAARNAHMARLSLKAAQAKRSRAQGVDAA